MIMSLSEFRFNKKRKHYAYLFKDIGTKKLNLLITSKPVVLKKKKNKIKVQFINVQLTRHPSKDKSGKYYMIPRKYIDDFDSFAEKKSNWSFDINDKRKIKRLKKQNKKSATIPR